MQNHQFRPVSDVVIDQLPFETNESAFTEWLGSLSFDDSYVALQKLYKVLTALDSVEWGLNMEVVFLNAIMPAVDNWAKRIDSAHEDSGLPLSRDDLANIEIVSWTYMQLASRFSHLYQHLESLDKKVQNGERWKPSDKAKILHRAFYAASRVQLYINSVYTLVHEGFWRECYQNYRCAEEAGLLSHITNQTTANHSTIDTAFKRILIFDICDTHCFTSREMMNFYGLLKTFSDVAIITDKPPERQDVGVFVFNLNSDKRSKKWTPDTVSGDHYDRYIDVTPVAKKIYRFLQQSEDGKNTLQSLNRELLLKVVSMLSKGRKRKNTRFTTQGKAACFIGFNNVVSIVAKAHGKTAEQVIPMAKPKHDPRIVGGWRLPDLDLVPVGDELEYQLQQKRHQYVDAKTAKIIQVSHDMQASSDKDAQQERERKKLMQKVEPDPFDIYDNSIKGYGLKGYSLLWQSEKQRIKAGELFAVEQDQGKRFEIGLLRRIAVQSDRSLCLGIELIGLDSDVAWLVPSGINKNQGMLVIFIPKMAALKQPDSVVLANTQLKSGQKVVIHRNNKDTPCVLGRMLCSTPLINHFELQYEPG